MSKVIRLREARKILDIKIPVKITVIDQIVPTGVLGFYDQIFEDKFHHIVVMAHFNDIQLGENCTLNKDGNNTLWHELAHAKQVERDYDGKYKVFLDERKDELKTILMTKPCKECGEIHVDFYKYNMLPTELEAKGVAKSFSKKNFIEFRPINLLREVLIVEGEDGKYDILH